MSASAQEKNREVMLSASVESEKVTQTTRLLQIPGLPAADATIQKHFQQTNMDHEDVHYAPN